MATSSARYVDLYDYARTAEHIDDDLINQADKLAGRLAHFEATCREPGFQVSSDGLGPALRSYGVRALPVDRRVRSVGEAFQRADGQANTFLGKLARLRFGSVLFRLLRPGRVLAAEATRREYQVKRGDTLGEISKRFGVTLPELIGANDIYDPDLIHPGQALVIPGARPPMPTPVPMPGPTPTPRPGLFDGADDKPGWLGEKVNELRAWLLGLFGRPAPERKPGVKPPASTIVKIDPIAKPEPPAKVPTFTEVPETIAKGSPYSRGPSDKRLSNCTWYAATALYAYTEGKINLHSAPSMGNAWEWSDKALAAKTNESLPLHGYVADVNKIPAAGTIITFAPYKEGAGELGHVAWVESAVFNEETDVWDLMISEEAYWGGDWTGSTAYQGGNSTVKRWQRPYTFPTNKDGQDITEYVDFIHWNPKYEPDKPI